MWVYFLKRYFSSNCILIYWYICCRFGKHLCSQKRPFALDQRCMWSRIEKLIISPMVIVMVELIGLKVNRDRRCFQSEDLVCIVVSIAYFITTHRQTSHQDAVPAFSLTLPLISRDVIFRSCDGLRPLSFKVGQ